MTWRRCLLSCRRSHQFLLSSDCEVLLVINSSNWGNTNQCGNLKCQQIREEEDVIKCLIYYTFMTSLTSEKFQLSKLMARKPLSVAKEFKSSLESALHPHHRSPPIKLRRKAHRLFQFRWKIWSKIINRLR